MTLEDTSTVLIQSLNNGLLGIGNFVPKFVAGLLVLLIGIIVASILRQVILEVLKALNVESFLRKYGVPEGKDELNWSHILAEIVRWFIIILFVVPMADVWGLSQVASVLNSVLLYIPRVLSATIIAVVGLVVAQLSHNVVLASVHGVSRETARTVATVTKWSISIFVILAVISELGVAANLIQILFTGLVAMLAIAGGIAFGLGGQDAAKDVVEDLKKKL